MYALPDVEEVVSVAKSLGINLGPDEAVLSRTYLLEQLQALDTFVQARVEEPAPPMWAAARQPARPASATEDPLNAWRGMCHIAGAPSGLLAGRTVSYKDHIALPGGPTEFRSSPPPPSIPPLSPT